MLQLLFSRLPQLPLTSEVAKETGVLVIPSPSPEGNSLTRWLLSCYSLSGDVQETDQSESSVSDDEETANQSVHFALQQDKPAG